VKKFFFTDCSFGLWFRAIGAVRTIIDPLLFPHFREILIVLSNQWVNGFAICTFNVGRGGKDGYNGNNRTGKKITSQ